MMRRLTSLLFTASLLVSGCTEPGPATTTSKETPAPDKASEDGDEAKEDETPQEPESTLPDAADLLAKSVDAVGGKAKLESVKSFHLEGTIGAPKQNLSGKVETWWKGGDFYMVQTIPGLGINRSGKKGDLIWAEEPINGLRKLDGKEAEQHMWASSLLLTADWRNFFEKATTVAERDIKGKKAYDIELSAKSGAILTVTIDATSHLMVEQSFKVFSPLGSMPVTIRSTDYRDVEGMKIPYKQVTDASLMELTQELSVVELNAPVDEANFAMPTEDVAVVDAKDPGSIGTVPPPEKKLVGNDLPAAAPEKK
ncbi:MAG: hypothetical protein ACRBN8_23880 [Nannocystales bacterium]